MIEIEIEKWIPPVPRNKYNFSEMEIGDSFFVKGRTTRTISGSINRARKKYKDRAFVSKTFPEGVRVWRTK